MKYIITALDAEARAIVEHYRLKRDYTLPYTLYSGEEMILLVSGMGKTNAAMALSAVLGWRIPADNDILINVGICGAPNRYPLGETLLIHQIYDGARYYYPDILYNHPFTESSLICLDAPQTDPIDLPADMESSGIFQAASRFFKLHQMAFLKIVSDHFDPSSVSKEGVVSLISSRIPELQTLIDSLLSAQSNTPLFTSDELLLIATWKDVFTLSQGIKLEEALCYFRLKNPNRAIEFPQQNIPSSKRERSALLEEYIATLVS